MKFRSIVLLCAVLFQSCFDYGGGGGGGGPLPKNDSGITDGGGGGGGTGGGSGGSGGGPPTPVTVEVVGTVLDNNGVPVRAALLKIGNLSTESTPSGRFALQVATTVGARLIVQADAPASMPNFAPTLATVDVKPGVTKFNVPLVMARMASTTLNTNSGGSLSVDAGPTSFTVTVPPMGGAAQSFVLSAANYDYRSGPGRLEAREPDGGILPLQSAGMFFVRVTDMSGNPMTMPSGVQVTFPPQSLPQVPMAQPMNVWTLNPSTGQWSNPTPTTDPSGGMTLTGIPPSTIFNCDRGFPGACIKGRIASDGGRCSGQKLTALGPRGTASSDTTGADGEFCVLTPVGVNMSFNTGNSMFTTSAPTSFGSCSIPTSCKDVTVPISADDCVIADGGASCNAQSQAGNNQPFTRTYEMGKTSGSFTITYDMQQVKDRLRVSYEGQLLLDTGCISAGTTRTLNFNGFSTEVTVSVEPNCEPGTGGTNTAWSFKLTCPP